MTIALSSSIFKGGTGSLHCQQCNKEDACSAFSAGLASSRGRISQESTRNAGGGSRRVIGSSSISFRCKNPLFGGLRSHLLSSGQDFSSIKAWVAADHSESVPNASNYMRDTGYHHLEDVKEQVKRQNTLTDAEIARTAVEANRKALIVFPGIVHCEPHSHVSWAEYPFVIDDFGDMYFEISDHENLLHDRGASNPVNVLIGLDVPTYRASKRPTDLYDDGLDVSSGDELYLEEDDYDENEEMDFAASATDWGFLDSMRWVHPLYFARNITKAVDTKYRERMDHPSNGVSIVGLLRPAFWDEEPNLRNLFQSPDSDDYSSDWKEEPDIEVVDDDRTYDLDDNYILDSKAQDDGTIINSSLYKLEIMSIQLFTVNGNQSGISLQDFQDAEPDILVHSAPAIIDRLNDYGPNCSVALKTLCRKKKGLKVEGASIIGVDSLGLDVRVSYGVEAQTLRFAFNARAASEMAAEKKIKRMLFPRYQRKNFKASKDEQLDVDSKR